MLWIGGFIPIIIYSSIFSGFEEDDALITENGLNIETENNLDIFTET